MSTQLFLGFVDKLSWKSNECIFSDYYPGSKGLLVRIRTLQETWTFLGTEPLDRSQLWPTFLNQLVEPLMPFLHESLPQRISALVQSLRSPSPHCGSLLSKACFPHLSENAGSPQSSGRSGNILSAPASRNTFPGVHCPMFCFHFFL